MVFILFTNFGVNHLYISCVLHSLYIIITYKFHVNYNLISNTILKLISKKILRPNSKEKLISIFRTIPIHFVQIYTWLHLHR